MYIISVLAGVIIIDDGRRLMCVSINEFQQGACASARAPCVSLMFLIMASIVYI